MDPLFSFLALRVLPDLTRLALRLFRVARVFEAIIIHPFKGENLSTWCPIVKFLLPLIPLISWAGQVSLSKGGHKVLNIPHLSRFTVGNKDVLGVRSGPGKLILKGKKQGFSELMVWRKSEKAESWKVYVISKTQHLKLTQLQDSLIKLGLKAHFSGPFIYAEGEVLRLKDYFTVKKLQQKFHRHLISNFWPSKKLRDQLIARLYQEFLPFGHQSIQCSSEGLRFFCSFEQGDLPSKKEQRNWSRNYFIEFKNRKPIQLRKNFRLKLKLVQTERLDGKELNPGLDYLEGKWDNLFKTSLQKILSENLYRFNQKEVQLSTLAEPQALTSLNQNLLIQLGAEIPYPTQDEDHPKTDWKFAGLKLKLKLEKKLNRYFLKYEHEFTAPVETQVAGSKEKSSVFIDLGKSLKIFEITFQMNGTQRSELPFLSSVPLLGRIFTSINTQKNYKRISAYIVVELI